MKLAFWVGGFVYGNPHIMKSSLVKKAVSFFFAAQVLSKPTSSSKASDRTAFGSELFGGSVVWE
jgi:hypothetical protein